MPASIVGVLVPYLSLKRYETLEALSRPPLTLSSDAVVILDSAVTAHYIDQIVNKFNADHPAPVPLVSFEKRAKEVQAVTVSLSYQLGQKVHMRPYFSL